MTASTERAQLDILTVGTVTFREYGVRTPSFPFQISTEALQHTQTHSPGNTNQPLQPSAK